MMLLSVSSHVLRDHAEQKRQLTEDTLLFSEFSTRLGVTRKGEAGFWELGSAKSEARRLSFSLCYTML